MPARILIANRGEVAVRVIQACRERGFASLLAHSTVDRDSLAARLADETVCIGLAPPGQSYLDTDALLAAAQSRGADAVHPGYGFLSESEEFAARVEGLGLIWIGPRPEQLLLAGDKVAARRLAREAGLPVLPGTEVVRSLSELRRAANELGFPVVLKARGGGGGRGLRWLRGPELLEHAFSAASIEAGAAFGSSELYLERGLAAPRHIEVQIFGDGHGRVATLGERDCSVQRRHQKLVEETPAPALEQRLRLQLWSAARRLGEKLRYRGAGTVEFLVAQGRYYFIELNARLQVEHPITELVSGVDLVGCQLALAFGQPIDLAQAVLSRGHAIECRVHCEDSLFRPSVGTLGTFRVPGGYGVRVDTHGFAGYRVSEHYDSLLAKVSVWGSTRDEAVARMSAALDRFEVKGVATILPFHQWLLSHPSFRLGGVSTRFLEQSWSAKRM